jgi:hypothetical protein
MNFTGGESPFEALSELLQGGSSGTKGLRILLFALFLGLALFEGMGLWSLLGRSDSVPVAPEEFVLEEGRVRLEGMVKDFSATMLSRQTSRQLVALAVAADRRPFVPSGAAAPAVAVEAAVPVPTQPSRTEQEILPPSMVLRAVFLMGEKRSAVLDVEGESSELLVEPGTRFGGGLGRVLSISEKKVVVSWAGRRMELRMEE